MLCVYAFQTGSNWFIDKPDGAQTIRCYYPNAVQSMVAGGWIRRATVNDTFDAKKPFLPQIIKDADYVCVRSCCCNRSKCKYYQEREE